MSQSLIGYETTFVMKPDVSDDAIKAFVEKVKGIITTHNGTVMVTEDWGRRRLAYPINKETRGSYQYVVFAADNLAVAEIERNMRINESIMRFLTIGLGRDFSVENYKHRSPMMMTAKPPVLAERGAGGYDRGAHERHSSDDEQGE